MRGEGWVCEFLAAVAIGTVVLVGAYVLGEVIGKLVAWFRSK